MTNFDFLLTTPKFGTFAPVAVSAEKILHIDASACVLNCRRAMEFAVKWMYSVDKALVMPYQDTLVSLMNAEDFRDIVGTDIWRRMDFIRRMGNNAAHSGKKVTEEQAGLCLENLYIFLDFVAYCYGENYTAGHFDRALLEQPAEVPVAQPDEEKDIDHRHDLPGTQVRRHLFQTRFRKAVQPAIHAHQPAECDGRPQYCRTLLPRGRYQSDL